MTAHRPARINPDSLGVLIAAVATTAALALVSFLLSFNGLADAATWANVPAWLAWGVPVYVDGAILVYTVAALVFRARGESSRMAWAALALFASLSVAANAAHAWVAAPEGLKVALGVLLAGLAPVAVLLTTHTLARLIVAPPTPAEEVAPVAEVVPVDEGAATAALIEYATADAALAAETALARISPARPRRASSRPAAARAPRRPPLTPAETVARDARIRELDDGARSIRDIAVEVGTSKSTVSRVLGRSEVPA